MFEDYIPSDIDKLWLRNVLQITANGGVLAYPSTGLIYKINHKDKTLTLVNKEILEIEDSAVLHRRTIKVAEAIGYMVEVKE